MKCIKGRNGGENQMRNMMDVCMQNVLEYKQKAEARRGNEMQGLQRERDGERGGLKSANKQKRTENVE